MLQYIQIEDVDSFCSCLATVISRTLYIKTLLALGCTVSHGIFFFLDCQNMDKFSMYSIYRNCDQFAVICINTMCSFITGMNLKSC